MELKKLSEHIWYMPFEEERDRPNLGYVKGENFWRIIGNAERMVSMLMIPNMSLEKIGYMCLRKVQSSTMPSEY